MKRNLILVFSVCAIGMWMLQLHAKQEPQSNQSTKSDLDSFMQLKLDHAKGILEGLATEDFEQIAKGSQAPTEPTVSVVRSRLVLQ